MSLAAQAKILRVLENKEVCRVGGTRCTQLDIRFLAATNQDLEGMVATGRFRKDLFFRLNVAPVHMPALRERKEDVPQLVEHYAREFRSGTKSGPVRFSDECLRILIRYDWPGNIRELKNLVEFLSVAEVPSPIQPAQVHRCRPALRNRAGTRARFADRGAPLGKRQQDRRGQAVAVVADDALSQTDQAPAFSGGLAQPGVGVTAM